MSISIDYSDRQRTICPTCLTMRDKGQLLHTFTVCGIQKNQIVTLADLRIYAPLSRNSERVGAILWVHCAGFWTSGGSYAGGCGYHKGSAAAGGAIKAAGITLTENVHGCGYSAVTRALVDICEEIIKRQGADITGLTVIEGHA